MGRANAPPEPRPAARICHNARYRWGAVAITLAPHAIKALVRFALAHFFAAGCHLYSCYWPAAGDFTLGVASVLLLVGALVPVVKLLFVPLGRPEFGALAPMPLSELVVPGVP